MPPRAQQQAGSTAVARSPKRQPRTLTAEYVAALQSYAEILFKGGLAPKGVGRPEAVAAIIEVGRDVGLPATQALANIQIVNGRPSIYGDAALALVRASGLLEDIEETFEGEGEDTAAVCRLKRVGAKREVTVRFRVKDAKRANLWDKKGPWTEYPKRMLTFRARGWALRDEFGDVLSGLIFTEEAEDIPAAGPRTVVAEVVEPKAVGQGEGKPAGGPVETFPLVDTPAVLPPGPPVEPPPSAMAAKPNGQQMERFGQLRELVVAAKECQADDDKRAAWAEALAPFGVKSVKEFTQVKADEAIAELEKLHDPFAAGPRRPT